MSDCPNNGLLLLLQAAQKIDRDSTKLSHHHPERWDTRTGSSRHFYDNGPTHYATNYTPPASNRRNNTSTRCSHNELEKSRRAHLRTCMDALRDLLTFDSEAPRITTLTVLRKATSTIQHLQQKSEYLELCEDGEKQRFHQLMKRRQALRKKIEAKRNRCMKIQNWRERNRNYSECSVLTTSSEDSELDFNARHMPSNVYSILPVAHRQQFCANDNHRYASPYGAGAGVIVTTQNSASSAGVTGLSPTDAYDASSSDSGFEEVIMATNATDEQKALKVVPSVVSNTEEVIYTATY